MAPGDGIDMLDTREQFWVVGRGAHARRVRYQHAVPGAVRDALRAGLAEPPAEPGAAPAAATSLRPFGVHEDDPRTLRVLVTAGARIDDEIDETGFEFEWGCADAGLTDAVAKDLTGRGLGEDPVHGDRTEPEILGDRHALDRTAERTALAYALRMAPIMAAAVPDPACGWAVPARPRLPRGA